MRPLLFLHPDPFFVTIQGQSPSNESAQESVLSHWLAKGVGTARSQPIRRISSGPTEVSGELKNRPTSHQPCRYIPIQTRRILRPQLCWLPATPGMSIQKTGWLGHAHSEDKSISATGLEVWLYLLDNARSFLDDQNLIGIEISENLNLLGSWPFHFEGVDFLCLTDAKVQP